MSKWPKVMLGEAASFERGLTYKKSDEADFSEVVVLRANNIRLSDGCLDLNALKFLRSNFQVPTSKLAKMGCILVCTASGSKSHLGKVALVEEDLGFAFGGFMGLIQPSATLHPKYLFYCLRSAAYERFIEKLSDGANINNLNWKQLREFEIPLPPLDEQERIVAKLDEASAALRALRDLLNQKDSHIQDLAQGWRDLQLTASDVLRTPLRDVAEIRTGPFGSILHKSDYGEEGIPLVNPVNMVDGLIIPDKRVRTSRLEALASYRLEPGHVVVGRRGDLGRCAVVKPEQAGWLCGTGSFFVECRGALLPDFLALLLDSRVIRMELAEMSTGSTMPNLSNKTLGSLRVPLYDLEHQKSLVDAWTQIRQLVDEYNGNLMLSSQLCESFATNFGAQALSGAA